MNILTLEERVAFLERLIIQRFPQSVKAHRVVIVETIQNIVADEFNIALDYLLSERRPQAVVWPRHIAMALAYEFSGLATNPLAKLFNRLDHNTILYAVQIVRAAERMKKQQARDILICRNRIMTALEKPI